VHHNKAKAPHHIPLKLQTADSFCSNFARSYQVELSQRAHDTDDYYSNEYCGISCCLLTIVSSLVFRPVGWDIRIIINQVYIWLFTNAYLEICVYFLTSFINSAQLNFEVLFAVWNCHVKFTLVPSLSLTQKVLSCPDNRRHVQHLKRILFYLYLIKKFFISDGKEHSCPFVHITLIEKLDVKTDHNIMNSDVLSLSPPRIFEFSLRPSKTIG
jgi:hypothetical protein